MRAAHHFCILCLLSWLVACNVQGQTAEETEAQSSAMILIADARIDGINPDSETGSEKTIRVEGPYTDHNDSSRRPVPAYRERLESRVGQLSVDWVTPKSIPVRREVDFELVLRNRGPIAVQEVQIEPMMPDYVQIVRSNPEPDTRGRKPMWQIPALDPQEEFRIKLRVILSEVGPAHTDARITYSTSTTTSFDVVEPKLKVTAVGPQHAIIGNQVIFNVSVTNPGNGPTEDTRLKVLFPAGIDQVAESADYHIGVLNPGESRSIGVAGKLSQLGEHQCQFIATSAHGLHDDTISRVVGLGAKIDIEIDGPGFRYVNRPANYSMQIKNSGTAPANDVYIRCAVPRPFAFLQADDQGSFDAVNKNITWFVDQLAPGQTIDVQFQLQATTAGAVPIMAEAVADRGLRVESQHLTTVEGIAAILLEVVDVNDPIEVGVESFYEIIVTNQGTAFAEDVIITAEVPKEMELIGSKGPSEGVIDGQTITFERLPKLAPRADAIYRIKVRGLEPKDVRIRVQVDAASLDEPVLELESTKVYED